MYVNYPIQLETECPNCARSGKSSDLEFWIQGQEAYEGQEDEELECIDATCAACGTDFHFDIGVSISIHLGPV